MLAWHDEVKESAHEFKQEFNFNRLSNATSRAIRLGKTIDRIMAVLVYSAVLLIAGYAINRAVSATIDKIEVQTVHAK